MRSSEISEAMKFKHELEAAFEAKARLIGRASYSAVYSLPQRCPVMWLNLNPSGTAEKHQILSDAQIARGQHEFWHGDGRTSINTGRILQKLIKAPIGQLRSIQGTNVAWERSHEGREIDLQAAARTTAPFLLRYIQYVQPTTMLFGGSEAYDLFIKTHDATIVESYETMMGSWGKHQARIFVATDLDIPEVGVLRAIVVSHPSRGIRDNVIERCKRYIENLVLPEALV